MASDSRRTLGFQDTNGPSGPNIFVGPRIRRGKRAQINLAKFVRDMVYPDAPIEKIPTISEVLLYVRDMPEFKRMLDYGYTMDGCYTVGKCIKKRHSYSVVRYEREKKIKQCLLPHCHEKAGALYQQLSWYIMYNVDMELGYKPSRRELSEFITNLEDYKTLKKLITVYLETGEKLSEAEIVAAGILEAAVNKFDHNIPNDIIQHDK